MAVIVDDGLDTEDTGLALGGELTGAMMVGLVGVGVALAFIGGIGVGTLSTAFTSSSSTTSTSEIVDLELVDGASLSNEESSPLVSIRGLVWRDEEVANNESSIASASSPSSSSSSSAEMEKCEGLEALPKDLGKTDFRRIPGRGKLISDGVNSFDSKRWWASISDTATPSGLRIFLPTISRGHIVCFSGATWTHLAREGSL